MKGVIADYSGSVFDTGGSGVGDPLDILMKSPSEGLGRGVATRARGAGEAQRRAGVPDETGGWRLIFDRRPQNSLEPRLGWAHLPLGTQLRHILLRGHEYLRGSGEDLDCFYFALEHSPECLGKNAVGEPVPRDLVEEFGYDTREAHYLALQVWGMGDSNSCDVAQECHEQVLRSKGSSSPPAPSPSERTCPS